MAKKELTNNEHNDIVFAEIQKHNVEIEKLKKTLKPVGAVKYATLAECNAATKKQAKSEQGKK